MESLRDVSIIRNGDTLSYGFLQTVLRIEYIQCILLPGSACAEDPVLLKKYVLSIGLSLGQTNWTFQ